MKSISSYSDKWYCDLLGLEFLYKYPTEFIEWIDEPDSLAISISRKCRLYTITQLFNLWVNEKY